MVEVGEFYRHFKGDLYRVTDIAKHTETGEYMVVYTNNVNTWARPLSMFEEEIEVDGHKVKRFELERQIWHS